MSAILKVTPEKIIESAMELNELTLETRKIIERYKLLIYEMDLAWEGEVQSNFKIELLNDLGSMEAFANMCEDYGKKIVEMVECYRNAESLLVSNIATLI